MQSNVEQIICRTNSVIFRANPVIFRTNPVRTVIRETVKRQVYLRKIQSHSQSVSSETVQRQSKTDTDKVAPKLDNLSIWKGQINIRTVASVTTTDQRTKEPSNYRASPDLCVNGFHLVQLLQLTNMALWPYGLIHELFG